MSSLHTCQSVAPIHNISSPIKSSAIHLLLFNLRRSVKYAFSGGGDMAAPPSSSGESSNTAASENDGGESARRNRILSSKLYFDVPASKVF